VTSYVLKPRSRRPKVRGDTLLENLMIGLEFS